MAGKIFHAERWADAFLAVFKDKPLGEDADAAFLCLKAFAAPVKSVHGVFPGHEASVKLEKLLRESAAAFDSEMNGTVPNSIVEYTIRFICLLVEKQCFKYIDLLLQRIEQRMDEQKGILAFTVETAAPVNKSFTEDLENMIKERTGAAGVKIKTCVKPELLGGCLLRNNRFYIDASLKGQVDKMKIQLMAAGGE